MSKNGSRPNKRKNDGPVKPEASISAFFTKKHASQPTTNDSKDNIVAQWAANVHTKLSEDASKPPAGSGSIHIPAVERQSSVMENEQTVQMMVDVTRETSITPPLIRSTSLATPNASLDSNFPPSRASSSFGATVSSAPNNKPGTGDTTTQASSSSNSYTPNTLMRTTSTSASSSAAGTLDGFVLQRQNSKSAPVPALARSASTQSWASTAGTALTKAEDQKQKAEMKKKQNEENKEKMKKDKRDEQDHQNDEWQEFVSLSNKDTIFNEPSSGIVPYTWLCPPWPDATATNENDMELYVNDIDLKMLPSFLFPPSFIHSQPTIYKRPKYRNSDRIDDDTMDMEEDLSEVTYQVFVPRIFAVASNGCPTVVRVHGYFEEIFVLVPPSIASQILRSAFNSNETCVAYHHEQKRIPCLSLPGFTDEEMVLKQWDDETAFERTHNQADIRKQRDARLHNSYQAKEYCKSLHLVLEEHLQRNPEHRGKVGNGKFALVRNVDMVLRQNCKGYDNNQQLLMFRIQYAFPELRRDIMSMISRDTGVIICANVYFLKYNDFFDADIPSLVNFMANMNISGSVWFTLPKFKYAMKKNQLPIESTPAERSRIRWQDDNVTFQIPPDQLCTPETYLDGEDKIGAAYSGEREQAYRTWYRREFDVRFSDIISHRGKTDTKYAIVPPIRNLIFDLETYWDGKSKKVDPMKEQNCIYSMSWVVDGVTRNPDDILTAVSLWQPPERRFAHEITSLTYEEGKSASVWVFETEREFLKDALDRIRNGGYSRFLGHNVEKFDILVFLLRCFYYKIYNAVYLSPAKEPANLTYTFFESRGRGQRDNVQAKIPGINIFDTLVWALNEEKYDFNTLGAISEIILKCTKDEVPYSIMQTLFYGSLNQLVRFLRYNLKDSLLVKGIVRAKKLLSAFYPQIESVNGVTLSILMYEGISVRTEAQFIFWKNKYGMLFPKAPKSTAKTDEDSYVGGAVEDPFKGLHDLVLTGDFASLYPSIMMALNLCMSTLIDTLEGLQKLDSSRYRKLTIPAWYCDKLKKQMPERVHYFIKMHVRRGILAVQVLQPYKIRNIVKDLIAAAEAYSPLYYTLEANSKALKLAANGAYGWIAQGKRKCIAVPESVTFFGRCCIKKSSKIVLAYFNPTNPKWKHAQAILIYGDTDSIMVKFPGVTSIEELNEIGFLMVELVNAELKHLPPIRMDFEKIYVRGMWDKAKRYGGLKLLVNVKTGYDFLWDEAKEKYIPAPGNTFKEWKLDVKGSEKVRRDRIGFVRRTTERFQLIMIYEREPRVRQDRLISYATQQLTLLLKNKLSLFEFIESQSTRIGYNTVKSQTVIAKKLEDRTGVGLEVGERAYWVPIHVKGEKKNALLAEDPVYVLQNHIPVNYGLIVENKVKNAWTSMLQHALSPEQIDNIFKLTQTVRPDVIIQSKKPGIGKYTVKVPYCYKCGCTLPTLSAASKTHAAEDITSSATASVASAAAAAASSSSTNVLPAVALVADASEKKDTSVSSSDFDVTPSDTHTYEVAIHKQSKRHTDAHKLLCAEHLDCYDEVKTAKEKNVQALKSIYDPIIKACRDCMGEGGEPSECWRKDCRRLYDRLPATDNYFAARSEFEKDFGALEW